MSGKVLEDVPSLYHGTALANLARIRREGLKPFGGLGISLDGQGRPGFVGQYVFLTTIHAPAAAVYASRRFSGTKGVVLEVATEFLENDRICPDEYLLRDQHGQRCCRFGTRIVTEAECVRAGGLRGYKSDAAASLSSYGTIAYNGGIGVEALTRYAIVDFAVCPWLHRLAVSQRTTNAHRPAFASLTPLLFDGCPSPFFTPQENECLLMERERGVTVECF